MYTIASGYFRLVPTRAGRLTSDSMLAPRTLAPVSRSLLTRGSRGTGTLLYPLWPPCAGLVLHADPASFSSAPSDPLGLHPFSSSVGDDPSTNSASPSWPASSDRERCHGVGLPLGDDLGRRARRDELPPERRSRQSDSRRSAGPASPARASRSSPRCRDLVLPLSGTAARSV